MVKIVRIPSLLIVLWGMTAYLYLFEVGMTWFDFTFVSPEPTSWQSIKFIFAVILHSPTLQVLPWISILPTFAWGAWTFRRKNLSVSCDD